MIGFIPVLRARVIDAVAVATALLATGTLRVAPLLDGQGPATWIATMGEQFVTWLLLCLAVVALIAACEKAFAPGWRRAAVQVPALGVAAPLYAAAIGASPLLTSQLRALGLGETEGLAWYLAWFGWAIAALLSWYYGALEIAVQAGTGLKRAEGERQRAQRTLLESRLKVLEAQVEPRFLLDTLARVQSLYERDPPRATRTLDDLIDYLRAALPQLRERASTLGREMALVSAYLRIVSARPAGIGRLDPALEGAYAPPMVLLPVVQLALAASAPGAVGQASLRVDAGIVEGAARLFIRAEFGCRDDWDPGPDLRAIEATLVLLYGADGTCTLSRGGGKAVVHVAWPAAPPLDSIPATPTSWRKNGQALGSPA